MKAQREVEEWFYSFFNLGVKWERLVNATPRPLYPPRERGRYWVRPSADQGGCRKSHPPAGIDPRTVQTAATCPYEQSIKDTGTKFHENLLGGSRTVTSRQTNGEWES